MLQETFRRIIEGYIGEQICVLCQSLAELWAKDMECKESSFLETENFDENLNFQGIFKISSAVPVQNHKDILLLVNNI